MKNDSTWYPFELGGIDILANVSRKQQLVEDIADLTREQFEEKE